MSVVKSAPLSISESICKKTVLEISASQKAEFLKKLIDHKSQIKEKNIQLRKLRSW